MYPKLDLACGRNHLRPVMQFIQVAKDYVAATDANILVVHSTKELIPDVIPFLESLGEDAIFIYGPKWKAINKTVYSDLEFNTKTKVISCHRVKKPYDLVTLPYMTLADMNNSFDTSQYMKTYPSIKRVFNISETSDMERFGVNPQLLWNLTQALSSEPYYGCQLELCGTGRAIIVFGRNSEGPIKSAVGMIMPIMLDVDYLTLNTSELYQELLKAE